MLKGIFKRLLHTSSLLVFSCVGNGDRNFLSNLKSLRVVVIYDCAHNACISHDFPPKAKSSCMSPKTRSITKIGGARALMFRSTNLLFEFQIDIWLLKKELEINEYKECSIAVLHGYSNLAET